MLKPSVRRGEGKRRGEKAKRRDLIGVRTQTHLDMANHFVYIVAGFVQRAGRETAGIDGSEKR